MAAGRWMGRGDKEGADGAAVQAMRSRAADRDHGRRRRDRRGREGPCAHALQRRAHRRRLAAPHRHRRRPHRRHQPDIAGARRGSGGDRGVGPRHHVQPGPCVYMEKLAVGPKAAGSVDVRRSPTENLEAVAKALGKSMRDVTVVILDRPRHTELIDEVRASGARIKLISDGDVAGAISVAWPDSGVDVLYGIGGTPEGVIAAAALKCMGGEIQGRLLPRDDDERHGCRGGRLRPRRRAHHRRPREGRQLLLRRHRHHRRRAAARSALPRLTASPPSPSSCARDRGRSAS